jgi:ATP-dependent RNA helicase DDX60
MVPIKLPEFVVHRTPDLGCDRFFSKLGWQDLQPDNYQPGAEVNTREEIALVACASILKEKPGAANEKRVAAFLVHVAMLERGDLGQRSCGKPAKTVCDEDYQFLECFSNVAITLIRHWTTNDTGSHVNLRVCDLVDGRLFLHILQSIESLNLIVDIRPSVKVIESIVGVDISRHLPSHSLPTEEFVQSESINAEVPQYHTKATVLPFSHPILNPYLEELKLETEQSVYDSATGSKIFRELTHWHNAKRAIVPNHVRKPAEWWVLRRNQRFMADTIAYSASLVSASGKNITPESIVSQDSRKNDRDRNKTNGGRPQDWKMDLSQKNAAKGAKSSIKGGKKKALDTAKNIRATKDEIRSNAIIKFFAQQCYDLDKIKPLVKRYLKAHRYLLGLSITDQEIIGGELSLYICKTLVALLGEPPFGRGGE